METNAQYFDCMCRTCMNKVEASSHVATTKPQQQWLSIFDILEECGALRIAELLSDAVPQIVVQPSDELPKKICTECLQQLLSVYRFQQMCLQSDKQMHELLSKEQTVMKTHMVDESIKGETETNDADSQPLKDLDCSSTVQSLQQPSMQEPLAEATVQTIEPEAARSSPADHLQDNTQLLEQCIDVQGEFEEFIKNEPIEDDAANSDYSDGDTMHSIISVTKDEVLPIEHEDQQVNDASSPHNCHLCNKSYKRRDSLRRHLKNHKKKAKNSEEYCYACHLCSESYKKQGYLEMHLNRKHSIELQYTCYSCNKNYASSYELSRHMLTHTGEQPYVSPECGKSFSSKSILAVQRTNYGDKRKFNFKGNVSKHQKIHEGAAKRHECDICGKQFRLSGDLKTHKRIHSKEKPYKCDLCEKRFAQMGHLKVHIRTHTGEKPFKCKYCEHAFAAFRTLQYHLRSHLGKNIHRCKFCPLAFPSSVEMRLHLTSHKNENPEVREQNLKALQEEEAKLVLKFSKEKSKGQSTEEQQRQKLSNKEVEQPSTDILAERRTTHAEDKPYECPYCPLRFNSKSGAWLHKRIHEGIKPYKCSVCGKKFGVKSHLTRHKRIHSKEKPYKCDQCENRFAQMSALKGHIRTHTGEKPFKCKYCQRGFATSYALSYHLRSHLGENIHRCKFCPLAFSSSAEMRLHLITHKNEDPKVRERNLKALQEEEAKLKLNSSKEISKGQSTEELQEEKLCNKEIEQSPTGILAVQRITNADKPYECPYCPLRFNSKSGVSIHKAIHEEAKRHECDICGKEFKTRRSLIRHKLIHSEEKRYKCDFCEKRFTHMADLQVHIRTHTGEKSYKCKYCEREFVTSTALSKHLRIHLGKNIHRCKFCPLAYPSSAKMRLHLTSHKNEDPEVRERNLKALQEEEAKLVLNFSKETSKGESTEEQQQQKLSNKEIEPPSTDRDEFEEFIKNEPIEDDKVSSIAMRTLCFQQSL